MYHTHPILVYHTYPTLDDEGNLLKDRVSSVEIKRVISQKVFDQQWGHTWWDEEIELKDGRRLKIRTVTRDGDDYE
jgi:hypothetical protein